MTDTTDLKSLNGQKINGITSVDFRVRSSGFGVVNWNGGVTLNKLNNHRLPKLKNIKNFTNVSEFDINKSTVFVSQNTIKANLFKDYFFGVDVLDDSDYFNLLTSISSLVKGYVITKGGGGKRKSCLFLEDFITDFKDADENNGKVFFEQFTRAGSKETENQEGKKKATNKDGGNEEEKKKSTTIFSNHNLKDVMYQAYGSISIEDLQFISLDNVFKRSNTKILSKKEAENLCEKINEMLIGLKMSAKLYQSLNPTATLGSYYRINSRSKDSENGILFNSDAIKIIVHELLMKIRRLSFNQSKGYLKVDEIIVDFNSKREFMNIKWVLDDEEEISDSDKEKYLNNCYSFPFEDEEIQLNSGEYATFYFLTSSYIDYSAKNKNGSEK